jgi:hypothetical protein
MIDTDKYEGHDNWEGTKVNMANEANNLLIADAPLLLAEVERLREQNKLMLDYFWFMRNGGFTDADDLLTKINELIGDE